VAFRAGDAIAVGDVVPRGGFRVLAAGRKHHPIRRAAHAVGGIVVRASGNPYEGDQEDHRQRGMPEVPERMRGEHHVSSRPARGIACTSRRSCLGPGSRDPGPGARRSCG